MCTEQCPLEVWLKPPTFGSAVLHFSIKLFIKSFFHICEIKCNTVQWNKDSNYLIFWMGLKPQTFRLAVLCYNGSNTSHQTPQTVTLYLSNKLSAVEKHLQLAIPCTFCVSLHTIIKYMLRLSVLCWMLLHLMMYKDCIIIIVLQS